MTGFKLASCVLMTLCFACSGKSDGITEQGMTGPVAGSAGTNVSAVGPSSGGQGGTGGSSSSAQPTAGRTSTAGRGTSSGGAGAAGQGAAAVGGATGRGSAGVPAAQDAGAGSPMAGTSAAPGTSGASGAQAGASGAQTAGSSGNAAAAGSGAGGPTCALPSAFKWTSGGPLAQPKNGWVSLKDFTHVLYEGKHLVYMTTHDQANWGSAMFTFADWPEAATAAQTKTSFGVAPTLFYFTPKKLWVIAYQWGRFKFSYRTSSDPSNPNGWSAEQSLYNTALPSGGTGPIDQTVICNSAKCFLYYAGDNGHIYKSSLPIDAFPGEFPGAQDSGIQGTAQNLFEAVQVYSVKGADKFLMIVEAQGGARYFRAWTATDLEGPWTLLTDSFATKSNVTFSSSWTNDISHGDLIRTNPDETFTIDPCNLQMLFQGRDPTMNTDYGRLPYRPGLLTLVR